MDPNTNTRLEFTNHLVGIPIPASASPRWKTLVETHKALLDKLAHHEALALDINRTYMDPAGDKNKVYFMWDFVGRTLVISVSLFACWTVGFRSLFGVERGSCEAWIRFFGEREDCFEEKRRGVISDWLINVQGYLYNVPPSLENLARKEKETWDEATGRAAFSKALITDQMPGMLDQMMERTYPGQNAGRSHEFGEEILEIARRLDEGVV